MQEGRLLRYIKSTDNRRKILRACHMLMLQLPDHMGNSRTMHKIKRKYMWHGLNKDVVRN